MAGGVRDLDEDLTSFPNRTHAISEGGVAKSSRKYSFSPEILQKPGDVCPLLGVFIVSSCPKWGFPKVPQAVQHDAEICFLKISSFHPKM